MVMLLPVFVLAEGATVASRVAAAARLTGFPPTVPAALVRQWGDSQVIKISIFLSQDSARLSLFLYKHALKTKTFQICFSLHFLQRDFLQLHWFVLPVGGGHLLCDGDSLALCSHHLGLSAFIYTDNWTAYKAIMRTTWCSAETGALHNSKQLENRGKHSEGL